MAVCEQLFTMREDTSLCDGFERNYTIPYQRQPAVLAPAFVPSRVQGLSKHIKLLYVTCKGWQVEEHIINASVHPYPLHGPVPSDRPLVKRGDSQQGSGGTVRSSLMSTTLAAHLSIICPNLSPAHLIRAMKPEWSAGTMDEESIC